jgi:putative membrane protein
MVIGKDIGLGAFMMVLIYVILVFLIVYLFRHLIGKGTKNDSALNILNKRYAAGEITKEQFEEMKKDILL